MKHFIQSEVHTAKRKRIYRINFSACYKIYTKRRYANLMLGTVLMSVLFIETHIPEE
jgi:hypothetical protein